MGDNIGTCDSIAIVDRAFDLGKDSVNSTTYCYSCTFQLQAVAAEDEDVIPIGKAGAEVKPVYPQLVATFAVIFILY